MATTQTRARKRLGLTKFQRKELRKWRDELGLDLWNANDNMVDLKLKYREREGLWTVDEITMASRIVENLLKRVISVRKSLVKFVKRKELAPQYRRRLEGDPNARKKYGYGAIGGLTSAIGFFQKLMQREIRPLLPVWDEVEGEHFFITTFNQGVKAARAAWTQLFLTLNVTDTRRAKLDSTETFLWHSSIERTGSPPQQMLKEFEAIVENSGLMLHVFDENNELIYEMPPKWQLIDEDDVELRRDPESLRERAALHESKKARQDWGYRYDMATPSDKYQFNEVLTPAQQRKVTKFLKDHPGETFTIHEVAALNDVDIAPLKKKPAWFPLVYAETFARNPPVGESDTLEDVFKDYGLHQALWTMDVED